MTFSLGITKFFFSRAFTITQPAYEIGQAAAAMLVKALEKKNFVIPNENVIIPSVLTIRKSTKN